MERSKLMTDEEAYAFAVALLSAHEATASLVLREPDWTAMDHDVHDVFDLGNGGKPLWFRLDSDNKRSVQVTFKPRRASVENGGPAVENSNSAVVFQRHVYAAKLNVHVGPTVLHRFYVVGFVDEPFT